MKVKLEPDVEPLVDSLFATEPNNGVVTKELSAGQV